jgi:uncharacterized protein
MTLKASHYNFFFKADDGNTLAYNALSNSLARVDPEKFKLIQEILESPGCYAYDTEDKQKLKQDLLKGHFLIDETLDEVEILKMRSHLGRYSKEYLGLAIAPTLACNFDCSYCFEGDRKKGTMTVEVEEALIKFVENRLDLANLFTLTWFGGEPTLKIDIIERLTRKFKELCREHKVHFPPSSMISNGYLLTRENAEKIKSLDINSVQVTLDGPPEVHDSRRKLKNGKGTFTQILDNIKACLDILNIQVRINIDKDNVEEAEKLGKIFAEHGLIDKVPFYFGNVEPLTDACTDISTLCFNTREYSKIVIRLLNKFREKGIIGYRYPAPAHFGFCSADKFNTYVVAPSGHLYKCWNEINLSRESSVGTVFEEDLDARQINNLTKYLNWDPFEVEKCRQCKILPICAGGCPYKILQDGENENCIDFKYNLQEMLRLKYEEIKKKEKIKSGGL